jgi:hypothetical protein
MAKSFSQLRSQMSDERQTQSDLAAQEAMAFMLMEEVRNWMGLGDSESHLTLSDMRRLLEGLGGELEVSIRLPGGTIRFSGSSGITVGVDRVLRSGSRWRF